MHAQRPPLLHLRWHLHMGCMTAPLNIVYQCSFYRLYSSLQIADLGSYYHWYCCTQSLNVMCYRANSVAFRCGLIIFNILYPWGSPQNSFVLLLRAGIAWLNVFDQDSVLSWIAMSIKLFSDLVYFLVLAFRCPRVSVAYISRASFLITETNVATIVALLPFSSISLE